MSEIPRLFPNQNPFSKITPNFVDVPTIEQRVGDLVLGSFPFKMRSFISQLFDHEVRGGAT